jgi:predicted nuclease with TOPRIM domain
LFLQTLNWRHNPDIEKQINASRLRTKQLENEIEQLRRESLRVRSDSERIESETEQIEKENARLSELNNKLNAIVFSSATNSTPMKPTPSESEM